MHRGWDFDRKMTSALVQVQTLVQEILAGESLLVA
jgi:hypothetical protein